MSANNHPSSKRRAPRVPVRSGSREKRLATTGCVGALLALLTTMATGFAPLDDASLEYLHASRIVSPSRDAPARLSPGAVLECLVRLRLPLTPPPGVQQPRANEGWQVALVKRDLFDLSGQQSSAEYPHPVMRLRPVKGDLYRLYVELFPWLLWGEYDLLISGPGFSARREHALFIGDRGGESAGAVPVARPLGGRALEVLNPGPGAEAWSLDLLVPADIPGIAATRDRRPLALGQVALASVDGRRGWDRVLAYPLSLQAAEQGNASKTILAWSTVPERPCAASISWPNAGQHRETMAWRDLALAADRPPVAVIWRFGEDRWGVGEAVRHRWLLSNRAQVDAFAFDANGRLCEAHSTAQLNPLESASGCRCAAIGWQGRGGKSPAVRAFFLFR
jgi:hypothetical protein